MRPHSIGFAVISVALLVSTTSVAGQDSGVPRPGRRVTGTPSSIVPAPLQEVGIDQRLNSQLPLDLAFRDETGEAVTLGRYFGSRPVVLLLMYFDCPMLCSQALGGLTTALSAVPLAAGRDFEVVVVSFDPSDTPELARMRKQTALRRYKVGLNREVKDRANADGWHFLTGDSEPIRQLTKTVGFRYTYDQTIDQYGHATAIMVATPEGRLARYLYGIEYPARDLRLALVEASRNRIGGPVEQVLLYCFHYDPTTGRYSVAILNLVRLGGVLTLIVLGGFVVLTLRREKRVKFDA